MTQEIYSRLSFHPLTADDLPRLCRWLNTAHVSRWWFMNDGSRNPSLKAVVDQWTKRIDSEESVYCYFVNLDNHPIAYIQWYLVSDFAESIGLISDCNNIAGIDVFIGESDYLYKSLGPVFIRKFVDEIIFTNQNIKACIIDPEPENTPAIRAYEKVGFEYQYTIEDKRYGVDAYVMRLSRQQFS